MNSKIIAVASLHAFLTREGISKLRFFADLNVHSTTVYAWEVGKNLPSLTLACAIETYTHGEVTPRMWLTKRAEA